MSLSRRALLGLLLALLLIPGGRAQETTDTSEMEDRIVQRLTQAYANASLAHEARFYNLSLQVETLRASVESFAQAENGSANVTGRLAEILLALEAARNETLADHVNLYAALTDHDGHPILPSLASATDAVSLRQDRLRSDLANLSDEHGELNKGNEHIFHAADSGAGKATLTNTLLVALLALQGFEFLHRHQFPRFFWRRIKWEAAQAKSRGVEVDPECPRTDEDYRLGDYYECDKSATCKLAALCKERAVMAHEERVAAQERIEARPVESPGVPGVAPLPSILPIAAHASPLSASATAAAPVAPREDDLAGIDLEAA